jgi:hypothetical protein
LPGLCAQGRTQGRTSSAVGFASRPGYGVCREPSASARRDCACEHDGSYDDLQALFKASVGVQPQCDDHEQDEDTHDHSHDLVDRSILRSRAGIRKLSLSLTILTVTALAQAFIYSRTLSVALLADLIHNFGDALTAIPLGLAFFFRSVRGEKKPSF